jgi:hypothetical protein
MKKIVAFLCVFILFFGFAEKASAAELIEHLAELNWGRLFFEILEKVFFIIVSVLLLYTVYKTTRELLFLDVKGARLLSLEESRILEEKYREDLGQKAADVERENGLKSLQSNGNSNGNLEKAHVHADSYRS